MNEFAVQPWTDTPPADNATITAEGPPESSLQWSEKLSFCAKRSNVWDELNERIVVYHRESKEKVERSIREISERLGLDKK